MDLATRKTLTDELAKLVTEVAADLRAQMLAVGPVQVAAQRLHLDEGSGQPFPLWTDLLSRRAAVLFVLKSVYVRVLEDRGLLRPGRLLDPESQRLFETLAPDLGETAYLRWVYRDLASARAGVPELFALQPAEVAWPSHALSRKLLAFWRSEDLDRHALRFRFDGEGFDSRLLGDLYQDLDPVVKARYALLQTPDFVLDFILDQTLTPAIAEWGVEAVRVLDPACGSGHFLLAALKRLVAGMRIKHPERPLRAVVQDCLARVVGIDLNDYACALARARLTMMALELSGDGDLAAAGAYHPQVYWADALEQVERDEAAQQLGLGLAGEEAAKPRALLTRPEVRKALRPVLKEGFHVVVGNPPYITEKDPKQREYHREKVGGKPRYVSAYREYSLGAPFTERSLDLCIQRGFCGLITANSFMKREFGKSLIEKFLKNKDLFLIVDSSGAFIPFHGTPTTLLFSRNMPPTNQYIKVVMGKRAEGARPVDPRNGRVWVSILAGIRCSSFENEFISVAEVDRQVLGKHPWSIGGGGASDLKVRLSTYRGTQSLGLVIEDIGSGAVTREDDVYVIGRGPASRMGVPSNQQRPMTEGETVRDWLIHDPEVAIWPYDEKLSVVDGLIAQRCEFSLWPWRSILKNRIAYGKTQLERGLKWFEYSMFFPARYKDSVCISFAEVATHNHFSIGRGKLIFKQTAPMIKLSSGTAEEEYRILAAQLNSAIACFWLKQVCQPKSGAGVGRGVEPEDWMERYAFDNTKVAAFPLISTTDPQLEAFARALDGLARERGADSARAVLDVHAAAGAAALRAALDDRRERDLQRLLRMVGLQEELDWLCYRLYGLDPDAPAHELRAPDAVPPLSPGLRPFELTLAREDAERRAALARGEEPDEAPTAWFERHGWAPHPEPLDPVASGAAVTLARLARTEASRELSLVEQPKYKRRWYRPDHAADEAQALAAWLADRIEDWARTQATAFSARQALTALEGDPAVLAAVELLSGRRDFDLLQILEAHIQRDAVPGIRHHVYKGEGLIKRAEWEETWKQQHAQDAGDTKAAPKVPPRYAKADFLRDEYWQLRGPLDVPKERYLAFTEVPEAEGFAEPLYGWAGWTPRQRARALSQLDEDLERVGAPVTERHGLLYHLQALLPYVTWESREAAKEYADLIKTLVPTTLGEPLLDAWAQAHPPKNRRKKARGA